MGGGDGGDGTKRCDRVRLLGGQQRVYAKPVIVIIVVVVLAL